MTKIFIVSLPRTGTTSACLFLLDQGFTVAHTAYSRTTFERAQVIADTPVFVDYPELHTRYPDAKFIYLERPIEDWLLSIRRLLLSMRKQWAKDPYALEEEIWRCFKTVFPEFECKSSFDDEYLLECYRSHETKLKQYFSTKANDFLLVNITEDDAAKKINHFCSGSSDDSFITLLPHVNKGRRITYWNTIDHPNKVDSKL